MNTLEQELNQIAEEIKHQQPQILKLQQEFLLLNKQVNRNERINVGFNFMAFNQLTYSFTRFYKLADVSKLSETAKELATQLIDEIKELKPFIEKQQELPKELQDFLNK